MRSIFSQKKFVTASFSYQCGIYIYSISLFKKKKKDIVRSNLIS